MKKYFIDNELVSESEFYASLELYVRWFCEDAYDEWLDEVYEPYVIGCCTFYASQVLSECDKIAYDCGLEDYISSSLDDAKFELEEWGEVEVGDYKLEINEDDEDDEEREQD